MSNLAASSLASVTLAAAKAALFIISSAVGGAIGVVTTFSDFDDDSDAASDVDESAVLLFDFSNTMSFILESSMVVVMESIPLDVSISNFLVCLAPASAVFVASADGSSEEISFNDDFGSVAVFVVVLVFVVLGDCDIDDDDDCFVAVGGEAIT